MAQQIDFAKIERRSHHLYVFHHVFYGVAGTLFQFLRSAGAALINEHDFVVPRQAQKIGKKTIVRSAWPTTHDHQRLTTTENSVVDHHTERVHETFLLRAAI